MTRFLFALKMIWEKEFLEQFSFVIGWIYFIAWSLSFYFQVILNYQRKSTDGVALDFLYLNIYGFTCYSIYNLAFYYSQVIRKQYKLIWGVENTVQFNDVVFALHAAFITGITILQTFYYPRHLGPRFDHRLTASEKVSSWVKLFIGSTALAFFVLVVDCIVGHAWLLEPIYFLSIIKLVLTPIKYTPQVIYNFQRKSTQGWSILTILLDIIGGLLSILQQGIDSYLSGDPFLGNPVKFGLGLLSVFYDLIFCVQHYILYPVSISDVELAQGGGEDEPLIIDR